MSIILFMILYVVAWNAVLLLSLLISMIFRKRVFFHIGVAMQCLAIFGAVQSMMQESVRLESLLSVVLSVAVIITGYFMLNRRIV